MLREILKTGHQISNGLPASGDGSRRRVKTDIFRFNGAAQAGGEFGQLSEELLSGEFVTSGHRINPRLRHR